MCRNAFFRTQCIHTYMHIYTVAVERLCCSAYYFNFDCTCEAGMYTPLPFCARVRTCGDVVDLFASIACTCLRMPYPQLNLLSSTRIIVIIIIIQLHRLFHCFSMTCRHSAYNELCRAMACPMYAHVQSLPYAYTCVVCTCICSDSRIHLHSCACK